MRAPDHRAVARADDLQRAGGIVRPSRRLRVGHGADARVRRAAAAPLAATRTARTGCHSLASCRVCGDRRCDPVAYIASILAPVIFLGPGRSHARRHARHRPARHRQVPRRRTSILRASRAVGRSAVVRPGAVDAVRPSAPAARGLSHPDAGRAARRPGCRMDRRCAARGPRLVAARGGSRGAGHGARAHPDIHRFVAIGHTDLLAPPVIFAALRRRRAVDGRGCLSRPARGGALDDDRDRSGVRDPSGGDREVVVAARSRLHPRGRAAIPALRDR